MPYVHKPQQKHLLMLLPARHHPRPQHQDKSAEQLQHYAYYNKMKTSQQHASHALSSMYTTQLRYPVPLKMQQSVGIHRLVQGRHIFYINFQIPQGRRSGTWEFVSKAPAAVVEKTTNKPRLPCCCCCCGCCGLRFITTRSRPSPF